MKTEKNTNKTGCGLGSRGVGPRRLGFRGVRVLAAGLGLGLAGGMLGGCESGIRDEDIRVVNLSEVRELVERAGRPGGRGVLLLVDPRSRGEFDAGHLPGARNVGLGEIPESREPDRMFAEHSHVIVYGEHRGSTIAKAMTKQLMKVEVDGVRWFAGGLKEWRESGGAIEGAGETK